MFEDLLQEDLERAASLHERYCQAENLVASYGLNYLQPLITRKWLYHTFDIVSKEDHPDWPTSAFVPDGNVHIHLYIPYGSKPAARDICLRSGLEWRKSYSIDNARYPRKVDYLEEQWVWSEGDSVWDSDAIYVIFYRPIKEGDVVNDCKVVRHERHARSNELVISCKLGEED